MNALLVVALLTPAAEPDNPVLAAAKKRQEAIRSIEFVCSAHETVERGEVGPDGVRPTLVGSLQPGERRVKDWKVRLVVAGSRFRLEDGYGGLTVHGEQDNLWVCDAVLTKSIRGTIGPRTVKNSSCGFRPAKPDELAEILNPEHLPLQLACYPLDSPRAYLMPLAPTGNTLVIDGSETTGYVRKPDKFSQGVTCWVDPARDHVIRRLRRDGTKVHSSFQHDIHYAKHTETGLWLPSGGEYTDVYPDQRSRRVVRVAVDKVTVNAEWPDSEFDLTFPPGVMVMDSRDGIDKFVEADGSFRKFSLGIDDVAPPPPPPPSWFAQNSGWIALSAFVLLVVTGMVARRVLRKRRTPQG